MLFLLYKKPLEDFKKYKQVKAEMLLIKEQLKLG